MFPITNVNEMSYISTVIAYAFVAIAFFVGTQFFL